MVTVEGVDLDSNWPSTTRADAGTTGPGISAQATLAYFEPLQASLEEQNEGKEHALPEIPSI
ncbi:MAG: M2 family metallopeptidase [Thermoanaerobaculia bacterium]|nr:M2 family metallopeptidase [Thermoanaerobaculia bacterium]